MKKIIIIAQVLIAVCLFTNAQAQKLPKFTSTIKKMVGPKEIALPYTDVISYLGYAAPGNEDEIVGGKKFYFIYIWVPVVAPELGIRMTSPAAKAKKPIQAAEYVKNKDSKDYFDTYITLEKSGIFVQKDITAANVKSTSWSVLARNDDTSELPAQPSGSKYNSLLRYKSVVKEPLKALSVGLYRVGFTTYKTGEVKGTFLAEVASPVKIPGVAMAKTVEELLKQIKEMKK